MERRSPERIDAILESLEGMERAMPAPFLHTRIVARMEQDRGAVWSRIIQYLSQPAVSISLSMFLILLNAYVLLSGPDLSPTGFDDNNVAMVQDYDVHFTTSYEPLADENP